MNEDDNIWYLLTAFFSTVVGTILLYSLVVECGMAIQHLGLIIASVFTTIAISQLKETKE